MTPCPLCPTRKLHTGDERGSGLVRRRGVCMACYGWALRTGNEALLLPRQPRGAAYSAKQNLRVKAWLARRGRR